MSLLKKHRDNNKIHRRLQAIRLHCEGYLNKDIAKMSMVRTDTVTQWLKRCLEGGFEALVTLDYEGRRVSRLEPHRGFIRETLEKRSVSTVKELCAILLEERGIQIGVPTLYKYIKKNWGWPGRSPAPSRQGHLRP